MSAKTGQDISCQGICKIKQVSVTRRHKIYLVLKYLAKTRQIMVGSCKILARIFTRVGQGLKDRKHKRGAEKSRHDLRTARTPTRAGESASYTIHRGVVTSQSASLSIAAGPAARRGTHRENALRGDRIG